MSNEHKSFNLEFKELNDDGTFTMYAAIFGNVDRGGDVIQPGAFKNIDEFVNTGVILNNHQQSSLPIGYPVASQQDGKGLLIIGKFHSTPEAQQARAIAKERMAAGKSVGASIGYTVQDSTFGTRDGKPVRELNSLNIYEASLVNIAMNPVAGLLDAKGDVKGGAKPMDESERGLIAAIKRAIGLETKKGRVISAANHAALTDHASGLSDTVDKLKQQHKSIMTACKDAAVTHGEMADQVKDLQSFVDARAPAGDSEDDGEDDGDDGKPETKGKPKDGPKDKVVETPAPTPQTMSERREMLARRLAAVDETLGLS